MTGMTTLNDLIRNQVAPKAATPILSLPTALTLDVTTTLVTTSL